MNHLHTSPFTIPSYGTSCVASSVPVPSGHHAYCAHRKQFSLIHQSPKLLVYRSIRVSCSYSVGTLRCGSLKFSIPRDKYWHYKYMLMRCTMPSRGSHLGCYNSRWLLVLVLDCDNIHPYSLWTRTLSSINAYSDWNLDDALNTSLQTYSHSHAHRILHNIKAYIQIVLLLSPTLHSLAAWWNTVKAVNSAPGQLRQQMANQVITRPVSPAI